MNFRNILISCLFYFVVNKYYSHDCCNKIYDCCCDCFTFNNDATSNKKSEVKSKLEKEEEEHGSNEKEKNDEINNDKYLEEVLENFNNVKVIKGDFFKAQNNYEIEKSGTKKNDGILGKGGFGLVYKIKNKKNKKTFVLKQIVKGEDKPLKDIQKEIQNLIRLKDEQNILRIVDVYRQNNFIGNFLENEYSEKDNAVCFYIITEYCKNGNLDDFIENKKISDKKNLMDKIAYQIINAVHSCHSQDIAHRDLKPFNIFLDKDWNVKLGDFGFSKKFKGNEKDFEFVFTRNFSCYEILLEKERDPFKADLFSLGVTLFFLYTGKNLLNVKKEMGKKEIKEKFNAIPTTIEKYISDPNLNDLLKNLLKRKEKERCGWNEILESKFYNSLKKNLKKINYLHI